MDTIYLDHHVLLNVLLGHFNQGPFAQFVHQDVNNVQGLALIVNHAFLGYSYIIQRVLVAVQQILHFITNIKDNV